MCFSAEADFVAAALLAPVGVLAVRAAPSPRHLPIAALPGLFAVHQGIEAVVWLGTQGKVGAGAMQAAIVIYLLIAQVLLPVLVPWGVWLIERPGLRRQLLAGCTAVGIATAAWLAYGIAVSTPEAYPQDSALVYGSDLRIGVWDTAGYLIATCGAFLITSYRYLRWFGVVNVIGLSIAAATYYESVTSVWCIYAAAVSGLVLLHLREQRRLQTSQPPRPPHAAQATT